MGQNNVKSSIDTKVHRKSSRTNQKRKEIKLGNVHDIAHAQYT